jgi:predicted TIM-barrel fold metal-dependent hydrolase
MQIVDAHHHFWDLKHNYYPWLADHEETTFFLGDYSALKRDYLPDDYRCDAEGFEVVATVHVEAEWDRQRQVAETEWLHAINATHGLPNVVVGHVWLAADNCEAVLRDHMQYPLFRGVRSKPVTSLTPDTMTPGAPGTIQDPAWRKGLALLETLGLTYDLRVPYWHLDEAAEAISQHPNLPVVLNHTGFPWDRSDAGILSWKIEGNRGVVLDAVEIFGVERCMWASNFPVAALRIGYRAQLEGMLEILKGLSSDDLDQIFRRNAATFYGITLD